MIYERPKTELLFDVVVGNTNPDELPDQYKRPHFGFIADFKRTQALGDLLDRSPDLGYQAMVAWLDEMGKKKESRHWTSLCNVMAKFREHITNHPLTEESQVVTLPVLTQIAKTTDVPDHWFEGADSNKTNYIFDALVSIATVANEQYGREVLEGIIDDQQVPNIIRCNARGYLAGRNTEFNEYDREAGRIARLVIEQESDLREAFFVDSGNRLEYTYSNVLALRDLCYVAAASAKPEGDRFQDREEAAFRTVMAELKTGEIADHDWKTAAKIANTSEERLKKNYRETLDDLRSYIGNE